MATKPATGWGATPRAYTLLPRARPCTTFLAEVFPRQAWPAPAVAQSLAVRVSSVSQTPRFRVSNSQWNKMAPASPRVPHRTLPGDARDKDACAATALPGLILRLA